MMFTSLQQIWQREPLLFKEAMWPQIRFHSKQIEEIHSVRDNIETYVHAGNMLGKDFVAAFIVWWYFVCFYSLNRDQTQVRVVTTSVKDDHLDVLWSEITKFGSTSKVPLLYGLGGPFVLTHHELRHQAERSLGNNPVNYVKGMVASSDTKESFQGHHARYTLLVVDEASGVSDWVYEMGQGWMKRLLCFGNPNTCANFFYRGCKSGDLVA
jgi:phage terminase large subunit